MCKSNTYNPFLNFDHTISREQGLLVYIPINNELSWTTVPDFSQSFLKALKFSFYRPADVTGGASQKSRSMTSTKGYLLRTDKIPYSESSLSGSAGTNVVCVF